MSPWKIALTIIILCAALVAVPAFAYQPAVPAFAHQLATIDFGNWHSYAAAAVTVAVPKALDRQLLLSGEDLDALGIKFHRVHRMRLIKAGKFPAPIKLGQLSGSHNFWIAEEIFAWIASRAAARDELSMIQK